MFKSLAKLQQVVLGALLLCCAAVLCVARADGELSGLSLRVYVDPTNAPFAFIRSDLTKPEGLDIDIIYELQRRLGFALQDDRIFPLLRTQQMALFQRGEVDLAGGGMSATEARAAFMEFSPVYFDTGMAVMYSREHNPQIKTHQDLAGKKVLVLASSTAEAFAKRELADSEITVINNITLGYFEVAYGHADAVIYDRPILEYFAQTMPTLKLAVTNEILGREDSQYAFGFQPHSPYTRYFRRAFDEMRIDGTLDKLKAKWGLSQAEAM